MPVKAQLKQLWETKIASCFGGQPAPQGDNQDASVNSRVASLDKTLLTEKHPFPYIPTYVPVLFLLTFVLTTFLIPHASARAVNGYHVAFADFNLDSAIGADTFTEQQVSQKDTIPTTNPVAAPEIRTKREDDDGHDNNGGVTMYGEDSDVEREDDGWVVAGVGTFQNRKVYTFARKTLPPGLVSSDYTVACKDTVPPIQIPYNEQFDPANVQVAGGFLNLKVPGGQEPTDRNDNAVSCAEVTTTANNILYGSVRTQAIFSSEPGTCHGMFLYKNDTQETDIEYVTDPTSLSNFGPDMPVPLWYTNQAIDPTNMTKTSQNGAAPDDCTSVVHEYRLDWTKKYTAFYIDGQRQYMFKFNVPSKAGSWVWNNWANGDKGWSVGPPQNDNILRIQKITMYYNTTDS